ncbi:MAG TPA: ribosome maturation factor RimP [Actinomycetota bacterium]|nr:ribosome maturation factor RimP [Actinomycetota bacterium]
MGALEEVSTLAAAVAERRSLRLWDIQVSGRPGQAVVRVFVDADGGVDLDTVAEMAQELSRGLDLHDPIPGRYTLEVSSPGLERNLSRPEHFQLSKGRKVVIKTSSTLVPEGHRVEGTIVAANRDGVRIEGGHGAVEVPYDEIKSARTVFEWN